MISNHQQPFANPGPAFSSTAIRAINNLIDTSIIDKKKGLKHPFIRHEKNTVLKVDIHFHGSRNGFPETEIRDAGMIFTIVYAFQDLKDEPCSPWIGKPIKKRLQHQ